MRCAAWCPTAWSPTTTRLVAYDSDALTAYRQKPLAVVLPKTADEVSAVLRFCSANKVKVVPRGAGTSLSGGALPVGDGVLLGLSRMNRILEIDLENRCAVVQPGVTNLGITRAVEARRLLLRPRSLQPSRLHDRRQRRGKFGRHPLPEIRPDDEQPAWASSSRCSTATRVRFGGKALDPGGLDLLGPHHRLRRPARRRHRSDSAPAPQAAMRESAAHRLPVDRSKPAHCVADVIAAGIVPAAMEIMDRFAIDAVEAYCAPGYPRDAAAILIAELDGMEVEVDAATTQIDAIARSNGALDLRVEHIGRRSRPHLARPQSSLRRRGPHRPRHALHGRHHPAPRAAARAHAHRRDVDGVRLARRQRLPRRRRQSPPADHVRRDERGRPRPRRKIRRRDPETLRRSRRRPHRRTRRRRRKARSDAADVLANRT